MPTIQALAGWSSGPRWILTAPIAAYVLRMAVSRALVGSELGDRWLIPNEGVLAV